MTQVPMEDRLCQFMADYTGDECARDVLQLLGRHPRIRLSRLAIRHAVEWCRSDIDRALRTLMERRVVRTRTENGQPVFSLTEEEPQRSLTVRVATMDAAQRRKLLKRASLPQLAVPAYRSSLSARDRDIMAAARHQSAFVLPVMPRFTSGTHR